MKSLLLIAFCFFSTITFAQSNTNKKIIYRPIFELKTEVARAGTAFLLAENNNIFIVSAQHLVGTAGGLSKDYTGKEMAAQFEAIKLEPLDSRFGSLTAKDLLSIPNAKAIEGDNFTDDIFIAPVSAEVDSEPFKLSEYRPSIDDKVFLFAQVNNQKASYHPAVVISSEEYELAYLFENKAINLRATSGAPVLNDNFKVVGINLAGGEVPEVGVVGWANPLNSIQKFIKNPPIGLNKKSTGAQEEE